MGNDLLGILDVYGIDLSELQGHNLPQINFLCGTELVNGELIKAIDDDNEYLLVMLTREKHLPDPQIMVVHQSLVNYL